MQNKSLSKLLGAAKKRCIDKNRDLAAQEHQNGDRDKWNHVI